jgi:hypothetical protein
VFVLEPFGISRENALTLILSLQGINVITVVALGGFGLWRIRNVRSSASA